MKFHDIFVGFKIYDFEISRLVGVQENLSPGIQSMFLKLSYTGMIAAAKV